MGTDTVQVFADGYGLESWCRHNCDRCAKSYTYKGKRNFNCELYHDCGLAWINTYRVPLNIAERMGYAGNEATESSVWDCPEREEP